ncbi:extracellular sulfatase Sulf-2 [Colletotrichum cuscutae]|uniref:Extracellular sulfatase Sulf-2 n=1 Tax=Colletotrichum cuscutae TaxID=1209917 RepID=A0AAI9V830_9PEZI|nr:extracellular sulfatase Sulf-2 [Colletotrichum cuscutae]
MPFLIRYPAGIAKGSVCDDIICNVDFAPTFLDFANLHIPSYMQGESFRQLLEGNTPADWQQIAYHRYWMHNDIIHHAYAHYGVRDQRYKLIYWYNEPLEASGARPGGEKDKEWELFDCEKDPLELFNVYHDPAYAEKVKHMTRLLELKMEQIGDEPVHPIAITPYYHSKQIVRQNQRYATSWSYFDDSLWICTIKTSIVNYENLVRWIRSPSKGSSK